MRALVLGGAGFLGRHVVAALAGRGHVVDVGSRTARRTAGCGVSASAATAFRGHLTTRRVERADRRRRRRRQLRRHPARARPRDLRARAPPRARARSRRRARAPAAPRPRLGARASPQARSGFIRSKLRGEAAIARQRRRLHDRAAVAVRGRRRFRRALAARDGALAGALRPGGRRRAASRSWMSTTPALRSPACASCGRRAIAKWSWAASSGARWPGIWPRCAAAPRPACVVRVPALSGARRKPRVRRRCTARRSRSGTSSSCGTTTCRGGICCRRCSGRAPRRDQGCPRNSVCARSRHPSPTQARDGGSTPSARAP